MTVAHAWLPNASCDASCVRVQPAGGVGRLLRIWRATYRSLLALMLVPAMPMLAVPLPGQSRVQRTYCRFLLRCLGVRITKSGGPIRNLPGVLVVSSHMSWVDVLVIGAVLPGTFVAKAELVNWLGLGQVARLLRVIPIERTNLRRLPDVVRAVAERLRSGKTVVAFPEGTTWCGLAHGPFRPALFQAAIDAGRPVQPLRLTYHHRDGRPSTLPAYIGDDTLGRSFRRVVTARVTVAHVRVEPLQLPGDDRRDLSRRCEMAVRNGAVARPGAHQLVLVA
ncbi:MAG: 1-acyl-sn-glycerol-3-phosphate acyltransferase [Mycobacteriaceae bacterium]|nr:1-acyl-sn-glycerol-3-phosphate acyltransferase [Mycobacteriaceae bacterium]MBV9640761.1 1-acyl-sn-glycerol-3-phosphate acyltransferase [Mycobacteriaceae bacterium]